MDNNIAELVKKIDTIPEWIKGKNIFMTGATGFVGKVLIEKLLRSCPDLQNIYILIREKKGKSVEQRVKEMFDIPLFDGLRKSLPNLFSKVIPIKGDCSELGLGLSEKDRKLLKENIHIIYHVAASVRFDDFLKDAILLNVRGTREISHLALECKQIFIFIHVSTTYCHADKKVIEEKLYSPHTDWRKLIKLAETVDPNIININCSKIITPLPNTYTFTKSLAENVVYDLLNENVSCAILRPSIVIPSIDEPFPGWIDNFNGPLAIMVAYGKGILRCAFTNPDIIPDYMPVDYIAKAIILASWHHSRKGNGKPTVTIYNCSNNNNASLTNAELCEVGLRNIRKNPFKDTVWYPNVVITSSKLYFYFMFYLYQLLPSIILDGLIILSKRKPILTRIQRKILIAQLALEYFITKEWKFINDNGKKWINNGSKIFNMTDVVDLEKVFIDQMKGTKKYLLKEDVTKIDEDRKHLFRIWIFYILFNIIWYTMMLWLLFCKINIIGLICEKIYEFYLYIVT